MALQHTLVLSVYNFCYSSIESTRCSSRNSFFDWKFCHKSPLKCWLSIFHWFLDQVYESVSAHFVTLRSLIKTTTRISRGNRKFLNFSIRVRTQNSRVCNIWITELDELDLFIVCWYFLITTAVDVDDWIKKFQRIQRRYALYVSKWPATRA